MGITVKERFLSLDKTQASAEHNYGRYRRSQVADELRRTVVAAGVSPGWLSAAAVASAGIVAWRRARREADREVNP